jgi:archaellum component FlaG (FlaF/FlaG flagellin family)
MLWIQSLVLALSVAGIVGAAETSNVNRVFDSSATLEIAPLEDIQVQAQPATLEVVANSTFSLSVDVKNISSRSYEFMSSDHLWITNWSLSTPKVDIAGYWWTGQNLVTYITLKPGEVYHRDLPLQVSAKKGGILGFQVGFASDDNPKGKSRSPKTKTPGVYWSNPINLRVR